MSEIRDKVVEAMAQAAYQKGADMAGWNVPPWEDAPSDIKEWYLAEATAALDAALDVLGKEVDKEFKPGSLADSDSYAIARLLAVLRDERET